MTIDKFFVGLRPEAPIALRDEADAIIKRLLPLMATAARAVINAPLTSDADQHDVMVGTKAMRAALLILRDKAIKPLLAAAQPLRPKRGAHNPKPIDLHYDAVQAAMKGVFHELGLAA